MPKRENDYQEIELFGELFVLFTQTVFDNVNIKKLHLTTLSLVTMMMIYSHSGVSMSELSEAIGVSMPQLSRTVSKLEELGFVERKHNKSNRRVDNVYHTAKGQAIAEEQADSIRNNLANKLSALSEDERAELANHFAAALSLLKKAGIVPDVGANPQDFHAGFDQALLGHPLTGKTAKLKPPFGTPKNCD